MSGIFRKFLSFKEGAEIIHQPHIISADPPINFPKYVTKIAEAFKNAKEIIISRQVDPNGGEKEITLKNRKVYATGDIVAGYLIDQPWHDFVLVTDAHPEESYKICQKISGLSDIKKTNKGVTFKYNGESFAIDTLVSGSGKDNKLTYTTEVYDDAKNGRNLFTINSLYYDILADKIIDPIGGINDIKKKHIRFYTDDTKIVSNIKNLICFCILASKMLEPKITEEDKSFYKKVTMDADTNHNEIISAFVDGLKTIDNNKIAYFKYIKQMGLDSYIFGNLKVSEIPETMTGNGPAPIFLASALIDNDPFKVHTTLNGLGFDKNLVREVVFLLNLKMTKKYSSTMSSLTEKQIKNWIENNVKKD